MRIGYTPGSGWPAELAGTTTIPRVHLYEWGFPDVSDYRRFDAVILTNSSGTANDRIPVGSVHAIADHLNLTGDTPLTGPDFMDCSRVYEASVGVVYAQVRGPQYETPAEARMLRALGADVVGMSTALEALAARRAGCRVYAFTLVTNRAGEKSCHDEVLAVAGGAGPLLRSVLDNCLEKIK